MSAESFVAGKEVVALAGVEGTAVALAKLLGEVAFCRVEFSWSCKDLVKPAPMDARTVLPHGNSASIVREEESHREDLGAIVVVFR